MGMEIQVSIRPHILRAPAHNITHSHDEVNMDLRALKAIQYAEASGGELPRIHQCYKCEQETLNSAYCEDCRPLVAKDMVATRKVDTLRAAFVYLDDLEVDVWQLTKRA